MFPGKTYHKMCNIGVKPKFRYFFLIKMVIYGETKISLNFMFYEKIKNNHKMCNTEVKPKFRCFFKKNSHLRGENHFFLPNFPFLVIYGKVNNF